MEGVTMSQSPMQEWFGQDQKKLVRQLRELADDLEAVSVALRVPSDAVYISEWFLGQRAVPCLLGRAAGHPFIGDASPMFSSELFFLDTERGYARSFSRWYRLGEYMKEQCGARRNARPL